MGYYVRVFCVSDVLPPLRDVFTWCAAHGYPLALEASADAPGLDSPEWTDASILYKTDKRPIMSDVSRDTGEDDNLFREEIAEFEESLDDADDGPNVETVRRHLRASRYVVANRYLGDIDEDGYDASGCFLDYFVHHHGGMVHCDGEGFYQGDALIVAVD